MTFLTPVPGQLRRCAVPAAGRVVSEQFERAKCSRDVSVGVCGEISIAGVSFVHFILLHIHYICAFCAIFCAFKQYFINLKEVRSSTKLI